MHDHDHDDHDHDDHGNAHPHAPPQKDHDTGPMSAYEVLEEAVRSLLLEKGVITSQEIASQVDLMDSRSPALGAKVVARAWADPGFKKRLFMDAKEACLELGIDTSAINHLVVLENTDQVHHMVTCTLCSCYPRPLLGQPPTWYKAYPYRAKSVVDPRGALNDLGYNPPEGIELVVVDSNADCRYLIMPRRPKGTEGWSEAKLAMLITRDSMIGVGDALTPAELEARPSPV